MFLALASVTGCGDDEVTADGKVVSSVDITPEKATLSTGTDLQFHAVAKYADGTSSDVSSDSDTVWNTSDTDVATVTEDGKVTAVKEGVAEITAKYKGQEASESFAVLP